jgi:hypothetical protein
LLIASSRGNNINLPSYSFTETFAKEIKINGITYKNVWYFNRVGGPSLYVQKGRGIIEFAGMDGEVWVLQ